MYPKPSGALPPQSQLLTGRAVFTNAYAVIPAAVMVGNVASSLPFWDRTRLWILSRPLSGFAETFTQYLMEVSPGGGSQAPEPDRGAEGVLFILSGELTLVLDGRTHLLTAGGYCYLPPARDWNVRNNGAASCHFQWIRKRYETVEGLDPPEEFVTNVADVASVFTPGTDGRWSAKLFVDPADLRHDMHVNIVTFQPGAVIPFEETHVMEHGAYILSGKGVYRLNQDWVEVEAGDYIWLRAFCPQACYAGGSEPFSYLLYKDVNRHPKLA